MKSIHYLTLYKHKSKWQCSGDFRAQTLASTIATFFVSLHSSPLGMSDMICAGDCSCHHDVFDVISYRIHPGRLPADDLPCLETSELCSSTCLYVVNLVAVYTELGRQV